MHFVVRSLAGPEKTEWLVYAEVPAAGGDGALIAVYDSEQAARKFASVMNSAVKMHQAA